jgi:Tfp pilus assembly protein PilF
MSLGDALVAQKKFPAAIEAYQLVVVAREQEKAIEKADDARLKLAEAYRGNGQKKEALNEVTKVLIHDETNAKARELKAQLEK